MGDRRRQPPLGPRLPLDPLLVVAGVTDLVVLAERVGVTRRQVDRWRHEGFGIDAADRVATAVGLHPSMVWGSDWWAVTLDG